MANQVTLTFAGETKGVEDAFTRVGGGAKNMGEKVGGAAKKFDEHGGAIGRVGEKADGAESKLIGVHDVIDGTATIMQGPGKVGIAAYVQGWADLAGGMAPLLLGLAQTKVGMMAHVVWSGIVRAATATWAAMQWVLNSALFASPITWIVVGILLLVGVIILIATKTDWFQRAWKAAWGWIKSAASNTWEFIKKIPGWIGTAFSKVSDAVSKPFKAAFNAIANAWNNTVGQLSWSVPGWVPFIGGNTISVPHLPTFHAGGVVPGAPGQNVLAMLQAGETVTSNAGRGGGAALVLQSSGTSVDDLLMEVLRRAIRVRGGDVQVALGSGWS
ncbi:hypothetical protein [Micromonospora globispora]|uniref:hypothetical protein n=1 Tax=Micromonospora globispora TaxID=1450148 RepID=UPI000F5F0A8B|nr:hypothetical protein [Micromonospora globispora]RQW83553.1 hypothetical protein DKL51_31500 [Micromonospora globispora]